MMRSFWPVPLKNKRGNYKGRKPARADHFLCYRYPTLALEQGDLVQNIFHVNIKLWQSNFCRPIRHHQTAYMRGCRGHQGKRYLLVQPLPPTQPVSIKMAHKSPLKVSVEDCYLPTQHTADIRYKEAIKNARKDYDTSTHRVIAIGLQQVTGLGCLSVIYLPPIFLFT